MRSNALPTVAVVKKEEKETKLKAFISDYIARVQSESGNTMSSSAVLLVARSHESPVVRALAHAVAESGLNGLALKALILMPAAATETSWPEELAGTTEYRALGDLRLLDAHEQLWLDDATAWVGDCMRREPAKRDAYECYASGCTTTALSVQAAFDRLWNKGQPARIEADENIVASGQSLDPHLVQAAPADAGGPTAATRH